jgi:hypothetical protein
MIRSPSTFLPRQSAMSVLRMIKLFGWESKMNQRLADRREDELRWIWKQNLLEIANGLIKYVISFHLSEPAN